MDYLPPKMIVVKVQKQPNKILLLRGERPWLCRFSWLGFTGTEIGNGNRLAQGSFRKRKARTSYANMGKNL